MQQQYEIPPNAVQTSRYFGPCCILPNPAVSCRILPYLLYPAESCRILPYPAYPAVSCRILPYPAVSCHILPYPAVSCRILPYRAVSCRILPYPAVSCRILPYPAVSCRILPYPAVSNTRIRETPKRRWPPCLSGGGLGVPKAKEAPSPQRWGPRRSQSEGGPLASAAGASVFPKRRRPPRLSGGGLSGPKAKEAPSPQHWGPRVAGGLDYALCSKNLLQRTARAAEVEREHTAVPQSHVI